MLQDRQEFAVRPRLGIFIGVVASVSTSRKGKVAKHIQLIQFDIKRRHHIRHKLRWHNFAQNFLVPRRDARRHLYSRLIPDRRPQISIACFPCQSVVTIDVFIASKAVPKIKFLLFHGNAVLAQLSRLLQGQQCGQTTVLNFEKNPFHDTPFIDTLCHKQPIAVLDQG